MPKTVASCLTKLGLTDLSVFDACDSLAEEWSAIKRAYFKTALKAHPDKGGDAAVFREVQSAFDKLRALFDTAGPQFLFSASATKATSDEPAAMPFDNDVPSWEFYAEAAHEETPMYRIEPAKSGRSRCCAKGAARRCLSGGVAEDEFIAKDDLRVGWFNKETGTYCNWVHLKCWRVPNRVWLGLPDPSRKGDQPQLFMAALRSMNGVLLSGVSELDKSDMKTLTKYCMTKQNWAAPRELKDRPVVNVPTGGGGGGCPPCGPPSSSSKAVVPSAAGAGDNNSGGTQLAKAKQQFQIPKPGRDGKLNCLAGKTIVMTGIFPEVGGGAGLSLGKDRVKAMVESFGGRVTTSVSGKTDILLVGKEPGYAKVSEAQVKGVPLLSLNDVSAGLIRNNVKLSEIERIRRGKPLQIDNFSAGFRGNGLGARIGMGGAKMAAGSVVPKRPPSSSQAPGSSSKQQKTPTTAQAVPKTAAKVVPALTEKKPAAQPEKSAPEYTAAPMSTIDLSMLKESRFLMPPAMLPYRDEVGRISLHLLRDSAAKVNAGELKPPEEIGKKLQKWLKHAEHEIAKRAKEHVWEKKEDGVWVGPGGERREELVLVDSDAEQEEEEEEQVNDGGDSSDPEDEEMEMEKTAKRVGDELEAAAGKKPCVGEGVLV